MTGSCMPAMALAAALLAFSMVSYKKKLKKKEFRAFKKLFNITFESVKSPASWKENVPNPDRLDFENIPDFRTSGPKVTSIPEVTSGLRSTLLIFLYI